MRILCNGLHRGKARLHTYTLAEEIRSTGEEATIINLRHPNNVYAIDIAIPASVLRQRRDIIREAIAQPISPDDLAQGYGSLENVWEIDGKQIHTYYCEIDLQEGERHPIEILNAFGFPNDLSENLMADNTELAGLVELYQRRFMNERGFVSLSGILL